MDFGLTADQTSVRDAVRGFARGTLAPGYLGRAKSETFPWSEHNALDTEDFVAAGLAIEELAYADVNLANAAIPVLLMSALINGFATPRVRAEWLAPLVRGEAYVAFGLTEPDTGSDAARIRTTATATAEGYLLSGEKTSVTMLAHAEAMIVVAATIRDGSPRGHSAFLMRSDSAGVHRSPIGDTGWLPMGRGVLNLDGVHVPADALLGPEGSAFRSVLNGFDFTRPLLALTGIGCAQASVDETAQYLRTRTAFGMPLACYEGASSPLAEHSTTLEAARLLCYSTLWRRTAGQPHTAEAAMTKWYGPLVAGRAIKECLLLHGNYGYSSELPYEQRLRDVLALEIADGTAQIQKIIIARERFGSEFQPYDRH